MMMMKDALTTTLFATEVLHTKTQKKSADDKRWWSDGFENWDHAAFKKRIRLSRRNFYMLQCFHFLFFIYAFLSKDDYNPRRVN